jgi:hypothetical protein
MKYILEIYYEGECIEQRWYTDPFIPPIVGDEIYIEFQNSNYFEEYGNWWKVRARKHLLFAPKERDWWKKTGTNELSQPNKNDLQTVQLYCEPCPHREPTIP